jgi:two-component system cell cycle sensor histidine kinase/response regulator CckA
MKILHVEDNPLDAGLVEAALARRGDAVQFRQVATISEARQAMLQHGAPDILLTDLALPDGSGLELLRDVRDQGFSTAVVVLTGSGDENQVAEVLRAGADDYLVKRADCIRTLPNLLDAALLRFHDDSRFRLRGLRVLYADPDPRDQEATVAHVRRHASQIQMEAVPDAPSVLRLLPASAEEVCEWDLVLVDHKLAGMNGLEILEEVCLRRKLTVPVVLITGQGDEEIASRALRLGAADYLVKSPGYLNSLPEAVIEAYSRHQLRREQAVLRASSSRFRKLTERLGHYLTSSPTITYALELTEDGPASTWVSENITRIIGHGVEVALQAGWWDSHVHPEDLPSASQSIQRLLASADGQFVHEYRFCHADGSYRWLRDDLRLRRDEAGRPVEVVGTWTDITESRAAELAVRAEKEFSEAVIQSLPGLFFLFDGEGRMLRWNHRLQEVMGLSEEELAGWRVLDSIVAEDRPLVEASIREVLERGESQLEARVTAVGGKILHFLFNSHRLLVEGRACVLGVGIDTTEKRRLEAQFLRAQRLESVGRLAGGIAHDLNNLLSPMIMVPGMVRERTPDPEIAELMRLVEENAKRGADIVRQLLTFGRGVEGRREPLQVLDLVREVGRVIQSTFPKNIVVREPSVDVKPWLVAADSTQIHQVLLNLCLNARDAMPHGGTLEMGVENVELDEAFAAMTPYARPGRHVLISVTDTGSGISGDHLDQIFDPFFTTKELGHGTGLGLSTVLGIVKSHGGFIQVLSQRGQGTQMRVYLPAPDAPVEVAEQAGEGSGQAGRGRGELVLVVDDEESFRKIIRSVLENGGYRVQEAEDGAAALTICAERGDEIDVLLVDDAMPYMDGRMLLQAVARLDLRAGVVMVSGQAFDEPTRRQLRPLVGEFLTKPFSASVLFEVLRRVLATRPF